MLLQWNGSKATGRDEACQSHGFGHGAVTSTHGLHPPRGKATTPIGWAVSHSSHCNRYLSNNNLRALPCGRMCTYRPTSDGQTVRHWTHRLSQPPTKKKPLAKSSAPLPLYREREGVNGFALQLGIVRPQWPWAPDPCSISRVRRTTIGHGGQRGTDASGP